MLGWPNMRSNGYHANVAAIMRKTAKRRLLVAVDPAGIVHKRRTYRVYTHVVFARRDYAYLRDGIPARADEARAFWRYNASILDGTNPELERLSFETVAAYAQRVAGLVEYATDNNQGRSEDDAVAEFVAEATAHIADEEARDEWLLIGWCGRRELADKLARGAARARWLREVVVVPVTEDSADASDCNDGEQ